MICVSMVSRMLATRIRTYNIICIAFFAFLPFFSFFQAFRTLFSHYLFTFNFWPIFWEYFLKNFLWNFFRIFKPNSRNTFYSSVCIDCNTLPRWFSQAPNTNMTSFFRFEAYVSRFINFTKKTSTFIKSLENAK